VKASMGKTVSFKDLLRVNVGEDCGRMDAASAIRNLGTGFSMCDYVEDGSGNPVPRSEVPGGGVGVESKGIAVTLFFPFAGGQAR
jgi:hypothetical protein